MQSGVFQVSDGGLFDEISHTQGGMNHLMQYLWDAYVRHLETELEARVAADKPAATLQQAKKNAPASHFAKWAADHLRENRVVENFFIDANHGVRLSNNACLAICPGTVIQGTMQDSGAVSVTQGRSQRDMDGVVGTTSLRI